MRVAALRLKNVGPFRGEHLLELGGKAYAVVARLRSDPERSNWLGKSFLLKAIPLGLYGVHDFRTEDEWISDGEASGEVEIRLDDGARILRARERGRRTTAYFFAKGDQAGAVKDEAEARIAEHLGLSQDDFSHTCWFRQKQMARFVTVEPSERMKIVSTWLRLEPLEACEALAKQMAADLEADEKQGEGHLAAIEAREKEIARALTSGGSDDPDVAKKAVDIAIPKADDAIRSLATSLAGLEEEFERAARLQAAKSKVAEYDQVIVAGKAIAAEFARRNLPVLRQAWEARASARDAAACESSALVREAASKEDAARGQFSGQCPVAKIECPAKARINEDREASRAAYDEASSRAREAAKKLDALGEDERSARARVQEAERMEQKLADLRDLAKKLAPEAKAARAGDVPDLPDLRSKTERCRGGLIEARLALAKLHAWEKELADIEKTRATLAAAREARAAKLGTYREAIVVFGKRGAQRRVAEGALGHMERGANEVLRRSGADMTIEVRWSREGKGLASACDTCGHPFPASAKVKHCERCGQPRGPKLENKLDIALGRRSDGAAADLAGAGFQLAASRWLRESRGTRWSAALLDEPFGALDAAHRRGFSTHLAAMLAGEYGFEQALVVAHHAGILDALPGRIEIESDGTWAVPRVIA